MLAWQTKKFLWAKSHLKRRKRLSKNHPCGPVKKKPAAKAKSPKGKSPKAKAKGKGKPKSKAKANCLKRPAASGETAQPAHGWAEGLQEDKEEEEEEAPEVEEDGFLENNA